MSWLFFAFSGPVLWAISVHRYALLFAPLSIVQAIGSTTTLFVFAFGIVISLLYPRFGRENLSGRELAQKGIAAAFVAIGVALVTH